MEVELVEIREFLQRCAPFDRLPDSVLNQLPRLLTIEYLRRGTEFPPPARSDSEHAIIVRTGAVELRDRDGNLVDKLGECDVYAGSCGDNGGEPALQGHTVEDSLIYVLPCERFRALQQSYPDFDDHFHESIRVRLRQAVRGLSPPDVASGGLFQVRVGDLISRAPVRAGPSINIREAASLMTEQRVSALLVMDGEHLLGLVTDRDLRSRCIAAGLDAAQPVSEIMTRRLHSISAAATGFEALMTMARLNIHHLPVMDRGTVGGLISNTDLIRQQSSTALHLADEIRKCDSVAAIQQVCLGLREMQVRLVAAGTGPFHLGQLVSAVADAATRQLLQLAERQLGPAPAPYAWLAVASQARQEQTAHSDQDNGLLLADEYDPERHGAYFLTLANFVNDGLNRCGLRYCPGEVMARNGQWRQPLRVWRRYYFDWIDQPSRKAVMLSANFFDVRPVAGETALFQQLHEEVLHRVRDNQIFIAHLVQMAVENKPPLGFFRNLVLSRGGEHGHTLDLKLGGLVPIVDLARIYALASGCAAVNSHERLRATAGSAILSQDGAANLQDALALIGTLRARHQVKQIRAGLEPDNFVPPEELTARERGHLKDAFAAIRTLQNVLAERYQSERFLT